MLTALVNYSEQPQIPFSCVMSTFIMQSKPSVWKAKYKNKNDSNNKIAHFL